MAVNISYVNNCLAFLDKESKFRFFPCSFSTFSKKILDLGIVGKKYKFMILCSKTLALVTQKNKIILHKFFEISDENDEESSASINDFDLEDDLSDGFSDLKKSKTKISSSIKFKSSKKIEKVVWDFVEPPEDLEDEIVSLTGENDCYFVKTSTDKIFGFGQDINNRISFQVSSKGVTKTSHSLSKRKFAKIFENSSLVIGKTVLFWNFDGPDEILEEISKINVEGLIDVIYSLDIYFFIYESEIIAIGDISKILPDSDSDIIHNWKNVLFYNIGEKTLSVVKSTTKNSKTKITNDFYIDGEHEVRKMPKDVVSSCSFEKYSAILDSNGEIKISYSIVKNEDPLEYKVSTMENFALEFILDINESFGKERFLSQCENLPINFFNKIKTSMDTKIFPIEELQELYNLCMKLGFQYNHYISSSEEYKKAFILQKINFLGISGKTYDFSMFLYMVRVFIINYLNSKYPDNVLNNDTSLESESISEIENVIKEPTEIKQDNEDESEEESDDDDAGSFIDTSDKKNNFEDIYEVSPQVQKNILNFIDLVKKFNSFLEADSSTILFICKETKEELDEFFTTNQKYVKLIGFENMFLALTESGKYQMFSFDNIYSCLTVN